MARKIFESRKIVITIAILVSIGLYFMGVLSGLYANKVVKEETKRDIGSLKKETEYNLESMQSYINFLDTNLKNMQLEQGFVESLPPEKACNFSMISLSELVSHLGYYWSRLPYRLEEYEKNNKISDEYVLLKSEYAHISIRMWILAKTQYEKCNMSLVHGIYFYSADCGVCVKQGEEIDKFSKRVLTDTKEIIMFPIDFNINQSIINNLKKYYGINSTPALIINDKVFQGRFFTADELMHYPHKINGKV